MNSLRGRSFPDSIRQGREVVPGCAMAAALCLEDTGCARLM